MQMVMTSLQNDIVGQFSMKKEENFSFPDPADHHPHSRALIGSGFPEDLSSSNYKFYVSLAWQALAAKALRTYGPDVIANWSGLALETAQLQGKQTASSPMMSSSSITRPRRRQAGFYIDDILGNKSEQIIEELKADNRCLKDINCCFALREGKTAAAAATTGVNTESTCCVLRDRSDTKELHHSTGVYSSDTDRLLASFSRSISDYDSTDGDDTAGCDVDVDESTMDRKLSEKHSDFELPTWIYCTRYSDRPSAGPRCRRKLKDGSVSRRQRTSFTKNQLSSLQDAFRKCPYLTDHTRLQLATELELDVSKIKVWFQNRRASVKKTRATRNGLALRLMADGLYDHSTRHSNE